MVFGILDAQNELDLVSMMPLIELAKPLNVVIHKAFDLTPDPFASMLQLEKLLNVNAILTSGQATTALEGAPLLKKMCDHLNLSNKQIKQNDSQYPQSLHSESHPSETDHSESNHLEIIVAGRVTRENLPQLYQMIGARQYHGKKL